MFCKKVIPFLPVFCFAVVNLDYKDVVMRAVHHGLGAKIISQQSKVAFYAYTAANQAYDPIYSVSALYQLGKKTAGSLNASQTFESGTTAGMAWDLSHQSASKLTLTQPLMRGYGQDDNTESNYEISNIQHKLGIQGIIKGVLNAYWAVIRAEENSESKKIARDSAKKLLEQYKIKVKMGVLPKYTLIEQQAQFDRFGLEQLQQDTESLLAKQTLMVLIDFPYDKEIKPIGKLSLDVFGKFKRLGKSIERVKENNLEIKSARIALAIAKNNLQLAINELEPKLDITASIQKDTGPSIGVSFNLPLNDPSLKQKVLTAESSLLQAEINLKQVIRSNVQSAANTWHELNSKLKENKMLLTNLESSKKLYALSIEQNKYGKASSLDVVTRQKTLVSDQQALISNSISYLQSYIQLIALQGDLLNLFGIREFGHDKS